jgi:hypothetical protein
LVFQFDLKDFSVVVPDSMEDDIVPCSDDRSVEEEEEERGGDTILWMWCLRKAVCHMLM